MSEKWRHARNSVEIAWTNEQKVAMTSYGRNKNHDDEIRKNQEKANNSPSYRCAAIKNVWTDLKKKTAPQYNSNSLNCKKNRSAIIAGWEDEGGY